MGATLLSLLEFKSYAPRFIEPTSRSLSRRSKRSVNVEITVQTCAFYKIVPWSIHTME